ncbi:hypothetical protein V8E52_008563 [Russula decolorans]
MPQSQQGQNASAQPTGHYQQQGHGHGQAHLGTGGQYGQPATTQHVPGSSLGGNTLQPTSAPGQQAQRVRWVQPLTPSNPPGNYQGATGQGGSSSTSTSGMGVGAGAGAHGSTIRDDIFLYHSGGRGPPNRGSSNAGSSSNTGSAMPQSQQGQNASAQLSGHYQQQGHGYGQAHLATSGQYGHPATTQHSGQYGQPATTQHGGQYRQPATTQHGVQYGQPSTTQHGGQYRQPATTQHGGQYGQPATTQHVQGSSLGGNTVQTQSATSAPGQQTQQEFRWRNTFSPGNQQVAMGQGSQGSPSSTSTSGLGAGAGAGAHGVSVAYAEVLPILTGTSSRRCAMISSDPTRGEGHQTEEPVAQDVLEASEASWRR